MFNVYTSNRLAHLRNRYIETGDKGYITDFFDFLRRARMARGATVGESWR